MLLAIASFEFRQRLKRISTFVYFAVLATLAALWMAAAGGVFQQANIVFGSDKVLINGPYAIAQTVTVLAFLGTTIVAAMMGRAVQQDYETQIFPFFFTSPIAKRDYYWGRFFGALLALLLIFSGIAVGIVIGLHLPGVDPVRVGPLSPRSLLQPYLTHVIPNMLFLGACFFGLGALTRRMLPVYIAGVVVLIGYLVSTRLIADIDNRTLASLIDPIGSVAMSTLTRYWSVAEKNADFVPLGEILLANRLLWLGVGALVGGFCYFRFSFAHGARERRSRLRDDDDAQGAPAAAPLLIPAARFDRSAGSYLRKLPTLAWLYIRETISNVYFVVIVLGGALFLLGNAKVIGSFFGTNTYPVTYQVLEFTSGNFSLLILIVTVFYAGELVWRERDARLAQIQDSFPSPTWLPFVAKLVTLLAVQAILQAVVMLCGIAIQLWYGYTRFELWHYLRELYLIQWPDYAFMAVLALAVHSLVNQKYLGHFLVIVIIVASGLLPAFGLEDRLYRLNSTPPAPYSDMNGYGHFLPAVRWFQLYWAGLSLLLLVAGMLAWVRGTDVHWRKRLALARSRFRPGLRALAAVGALIFLGTGSWIYANTHVRNPFRNEFAQEELRARYEKAYKGLAGRPQPRVVAAKVAVDLHPHDGAARLSGSYDLLNKNEVAVTELYVNVLPDTYDSVELRPSVDADLAEESKALGWRRYALRRPLAPGERMSLGFVLDYQRHGFGNDGATQTIVENGTFLNSGALPAIGYQERAELSGDTERKKHGLSPKERMADLDDVAARQRNYISSDGDWIDFEATISTDPDQIALAPGYLQREWTDNGRRYFSYKMDSKILNFYAFLSARYAVRHAEWTGTSPALPIDIYYQPGHEYNLERMIAGVQDSLTYCTTNFGPYQHHQARILEFPRYASFAQSFPNTIPYSEAIGFIARVDPADEKDIDYPYYVTAHEIAHQWWAHQVIGANVQGATMMSETLAQYTALMVMKRKYGDAKMRRFLQYELDRYLLGRATERKKEQALYRNENQPYLHYRKGSLVMYALQDSIGEEAVNRALSTYLHKVGFQEPPYTISRELLAEFRAVTPPEYQYLIKDLFETIVLYENRAIEASYRDAGNGAYDVDLKFATKKIVADEDGTQHDAPMDDWVDIGVFDAKDAPLYLKKHRLGNGEHTLTVRVAALPARAGVDPINKLIDRRPQDNTVAVRKP